METTRHFTATVYVVHDGAIALHDHDRIGRRIPPGGHVDRDELPHETAVRECREETGLTPTLLTEGEGIESETSHSLPQPRYQMLYDVDVVDGRPYHQHIDHVFFATVPSREIDPAAGEASADAWAWYDRDDLRGSDLDRDVIELGTEAIRTAEASSP